MRILYIAVFDLRKTQGRKLYYGNGKTVSGKSSALRFQTVKSARVWLERDKAYLPDLDLVTFEEVNQ